MRPQVRGYSSRLRRALEGEDRSVLTEPRIRQSSVEVLHGPPGARICQSVAQSAAEQAI